MLGVGTRGTATLQKFQYIREGQELEMELYQADIRARFLDICSHSGAWESDAKQGVSRHPSGAVHELG